MTQMAGISVVSAQMKRKTVCTAHSNVIPASASYWNSLILLASASKINTGLVGLASTCWSGCCCENVAGCDCCCCCCSSWLTNFICCSICFCCISICCCIKYKTVLKSLAVSVVAAWVGAAWVGATCCDGRCCIKVAGKFAPFCERRRSSIVWSSGLSILLFLRWILTNEMIGYRWDRIVLVATFVFFSTITYLLTH